MVKLHRCEVDYPGWVGGNVKNAPAYMARDVQYHQFYFYMFYICLGEIMTKFGVNWVCIGTDINILVFHHLLSQPKSPPSTRHTVINTYPFSEQC